MLKEIIAVFVGGGIGSILRFLISRMSIINNSNFPLPTLISNILGCIFLGIFLSYFIYQKPESSKFRIKSITIKKNKIPSSVWYLVY